MDNYKVYVHINKVNGKRYYGITKQKVENRWQNGYGYKEQYFARAINKYGWDNFEHIVIFDNLTKEEAKLLEQMYIALYDTTNPKYGYNISLGGDGSNPTEETRKKMSEAKKGHETTEETRKKMSESQKGHEVTKETRKKISEKNKGKNHPMYGKTFTKETRKKMSESHKGKNHHFYGKTLSEEHRKKLSESHKGKQIGKNNPRATRVYCVELNMYFDTVTEASEIVGCSHSNISNVLAGNRKTAGGYHWLYAEDVKTIELENKEVS